MRPSLFDKFTRPVDRGICHFPSLGVNFWAIPKNASTTLKIHFTQHEHAESDDQFDINLYESITDPRQRLMMENKYSENINYIGVNEALTNKCSNIMFTRHPLLRMYSVYTFMFKDNWFMKKALFATLFEEDNTFDVFIDKIYRWKLYEDYDHVFVRQVEFLPDRKTKSGMEHIVDVDSMEKQWPYMFSPPKNKVNRSTFTTKSPEQKIRSIFDKHEHAAKLVESIYEIDYETFNYEF